MLRSMRAEYREEPCKTALNRVKGMPFNWTLNPYRGCTHACHYCFARRYQTQFELGPDDEFSSVIFVKTNFVDVLRRELGEAPLPDTEAIYRQALDSTMRRALERASEIEPERMPVLVAVGR